MEEGHQDSENFMSCTVDLMLGESNILTTFHKKYLSYWQHYAKNTSLHNSMEHCVCTNIAPQKYICILTTMEGHYKPICQSVGDFWWLDH